MIRKLGGHIGQTTFPVDVCDLRGYTTILCCLDDVPFFGLWDEDGDIKVATVWDVDDLRQRLNDAQKWGDCTVVSSLRSQVVEINASIQSEVEQNPEAWVLQ